MIKKQNAKADIHAVALSAGVSISTVSRSFNHPNLVNAATRKKIDRAVKKVGYIRNRAAQAMHGKRSATIGLIVPTIDHAIFGEVVQAFSDQVDQAGFTILMATHGFDLDQEYRVLRKLLEHRVDGVALIGFEHKQDTYHLLAEQGVPVISIWNYAPDSRVACVGADNYLAGHMAATHLIEAGHRQIGKIFPDSSQNDRARGRLEGAEDALQAAGLTVPPHWQSQSPYSVTEAKEVGLQILSVSPRPTAILCGNDVIAQGLIFAAQSIGLCLPRDLSVVGIGDFKSSAEIVPALTTIRIPARQIGSLAGTRLVSMLLDPVEGISRDKCDLRLIPRDSVCAPAA